jgi:hypothetical protein
VPPALTIAGSLVALGDLALVVICWRRRAVLGGVLGTAGFVLAVLGLVRGAPHLYSDYPLLLAGVMLGIGTVIYLIGQVLERLLEDAPDDA